MKSNICTIAVLTIFNIKYGLYLNCSCGYVLSLSHIFSSSDWLLIAVKRRAKWAIYLLLLFYGVTIDGVWFGNWIY
jgi:hypothetical protein